MMKKILMAIVIGVSCLFSLCGCDSASVSEDVVRIHIRANSNDENDQNVKLKVRDKVIEFITPKLVECENSKDVKDVLTDNLSYIENVANGVLELNGFKYGSRARVDNEYFPSRSYEGKVFPADYYDALILELGSGKGDNWWCVAYPPLCFVGEDLGNNTIKYESKLLELINKFWGK